ncbi:MAG: DNA polymerase III subunit beta [Muribaculaceae bacterium]|nr:DNA polymerase III subunit beta [Muribaculaceae bacterium]
MRFNVSGKALLAQLQAVSKVINAKNALAILDNFLLTVKDNTLTITGSDQENVMTASLEVMESECDGEIAVNAKRLLNIVKEISGQPLTFYINDENKEIDIKFLNGHFNFMGIDATEFPRLKDQEEDKETLILPAGVVLNGIENTLFAASTDPIRPIMTGIYWDIFPDKIVFVSSDTHKLVKYTNSTVTPGTETSFILPAKPAAIVRSLLAKDEGEVQVIKDSKSATFNFGQYSLSTRFIKGNYPKYDRVIPQDSPFHMVVDRDTFLNAMRRVSLFASQASGLTKINVQPTEMLLAAQDLDYSTCAEERVDCDYKGNAMTIGFNSTYLIEVLTNLKSDTIIIDLCDPARPGLFRPLTQEEGEDIVMLQSPMQVIE